jgi:hypothetical protein
VFIHQNPAWQRKEPLETGWLEENGKRLDMPLPLKLNPLAGLGSDQHRWSSDLQTRSLNVADTIWIAKGELHAGNASRWNRPNRGRVGCRNLEVSIPSHKRLQLWCGFRQAKHLRSLARLEALLDGMSDFYNSAQSSLVSMGSMSLESKKSSAREHLFYSGLAFVYALTVFVGFSRTYFLKGHFGTPHLSWLFHLHGVVFTAWTLFFLFQTALVAAGRTNVHRCLGWTGAIFAAIIVVFGTLLTVHVVDSGYSSRFREMPALLINGMIDLVLFCLFFGLALLLRSRPAIHKRLMVSAMLCVIIPAIARLPIPFGMIGWTILALSLAGLIYDALSTRRIYLTNVICVLLINICTPLRFIIAENRTWQKFTEWLAH